MTRNIEQYARDYLKDDFERVLSHYRRQMIVHMLEENAAKHILEVGPAYNYCYQEYSSFEQYTVVEPSSIMCKEMPRMMHVRIINDYLENCSLLLRNQTFDFIIFSGLLHEIEDEQRMLKVLHSLCHSETIIHISVPNSKSFHLRFAYEAGLIKKMGDLTDYSKQMQRCRTYDRVQLECTLQDAGFEIINSGNFFLKLFNQAKMDLCMKDGILDNVLLNALARMGDFIPDGAAESLDVFYYDV